MNTTNNTNTTMIINATVKSPEYLSSIATGIGLSIIAILAIIGNGLVIALFLHTSKLRKHSYGLLIWNLAIVDFLTGVFIIITPEHIIRDAYTYPKSGIGGDVFCKLIASEMFTFCFGYISMYTLLILALERRYAIIKAYEYVQYFTISYTQTMIVIVWIWGILLVVVDLFQSVYDENKKPPCTWKDLPGGRQVNMAVYGILFVLRFLLPVTCIIVCYTNIWHYMKTSVRNTPVFMNVSETTAYRRKNRVTFTCAVTSLVFFICWLPNQLSFTLVNFNEAENNSDGHLITKTLVLFNSCINPFIYASTNKNYRREFIKMICCRQCGRSWPNMISSKSNSN